jgi:3-phenylpropionate/trans-cinnamate dioxygenase ferredoxin subunit
MSEFVRVLRLDELPPGQKHTVVVDDRIVVLVRVHDDVYCIDDVCTHDGGPLGEGTLDGYLLACPRHGAKFDVRTGAAVTMPATEPTASHEVTVTDGQVFVRLSEE